MAAERVQSVDRAFQLLEHLADGGASLSLSELSQQADLPMPTIHRLLQALIGQGYVRQESTKRYALGPRLIRLGDAASRNLGSWVRPYLERLVDEFGETTNMAILEGVACVYVAQVASTNTVRMFTEVGRVVPLHSTGVGKALLSELTDEDVVERLHGAGMSRATPTTITTTSEMLAELRVIRDRGFAVDEGEQEVGVRCLAVPISGLPFPAALSVSGPSSRIGPDDPVLMAPSLQRVAAELAAAFGATRLDRQRATTGAQEMPAKTRGAAG